MLCCDSHVLFAPGAIARLKAYYQDHPDTRDLLQGPLVYDDCQTISTHFDPVWRAQMWGIWGTDPRGVDPEGEPFEIPMQGHGRLQLPQGRLARASTPPSGLRGGRGLHPREGPAAGRRVPLPALAALGASLRSAHGRSLPSAVEDKLRNYLVGHDELDLDLAPVIEHFAEFLPEERVIALAEQALIDGFEQSPGKRTTKNAKEGKKKRKGGKAKTESGGKGGTGKTTADCNSPAVLASPAVLLRAGYCGSSRPHSRMQSASGPRPRHGAATQTPSPGSSPSSFS